MAIEKFPGCCSRRRPNVGWRNTYFECGNAREFQGIAAGDSPIVTHQILFCNPDKSDDGWKFDLVRKMIYFAPVHSMEDLFREFRMEPVLRDIETLPRIKMDVSEYDQTNSKCAARLQATQCCTD